MTSRDIMPFGKFGRAKLGDKALTIGEVKEQYPDYVNWLIAQEGFEQKNALLFQFFKQGESVTERPAEREVINAEAQLLSTAPADFKAWWKQSYGERLRKDGEHLYIAYLRVALAAYHAGAASYSPPPSPHVIRPKNPSPITDPKQFEEDVQF